jgi:hypothetical protein
MTGFLDHFQDQIEALKSARFHALSSIPAEAWTFGGGTALAMFYFAHRRSWDVDIFIARHQSRFSDDAEPDRRSARFGDNRGT